MRWWCDKRRGSFVCLVCLIATITRYCTELIDKESVVPQVKKMSVQEEILDSAREEFLARGFQKASLERIADALIISKSNIYTYYASKDALFCAVVAETTQSVNALIDHRERDRNTNLKSYTFDAHLDMITKLAELIDYHRTNLKLLFFHSRGSSLEGFREASIRAYAQHEYAAYQAKAKLMNYGNRAVTPFFIYNMVASYVQMICEIVRIDASITEIIAYAQEYMTFAYHGLVKLYDFDLSLLEGVEPQ